VLNIHYLQDQS